MLENMKLIKIKKKYFINISYAEKMEYGKV